MTVAYVIQFVLLVYVLIGLIFALWFVFRGVNRRDPAAKQGTWGFRLLILPGAVALWPMLLCCRNREDSP